MINKVINRILIFILFVLIQGLIFNHITIFGFITPYIYPLFILMLPFNTPKWQMVLYGFGLGLCIDLFTGDIGFHALSTMILAILRLPVIKVNTNLKNIDDNNKQPIIADMGFAWFFRYSLLGMLIHQTCLVFIETFQFHTFVKSFLEIILNTLIALILFISYQYIFIQKKH